MCFLEESYKSVQKTEFFETALYMKSGSMP